MCSNGAATAACSPKDIYIDTPKEQGSWLKKVRQSGEYSNVSVIVENQTFHLHMLPLMQESLHLKEVFSSRGVSKDQPPGLEMSVELSNFPGGAATFAKAMDFCYSIDVQFSTSNIAAILAASQYLAMGNLMKKAHEFLEKSVYKNWRNCLLLWSAIDRKDPFVSNGKLSEVTKKCERGVLDSIATMNEASGHLWCNIRDVREMLALSSPNLASRVFKTLIDAKVGLYYAACETPDAAAAAASCNSILLYQQSFLRTCSPLHLDSIVNVQCLNVPDRASENRASWKSVSERNGGETILWLKNLHLTLTSDWQRATFIRYIGKWMMQGVDHQCGGESPPLVLECFLLSILVEATRLVAKSPTKQFPSELTGVISRLKTFRNVWLSRVDLKWLANTVSTSELDHYSFEILQIIVKRIVELHGSPVLQQGHGSFIQRKAGSSKESFKENLSKIDKLIKAGNPLFYSEKATGNFEASLLFQLKKKTLSVEQCLTLLQDFPSSLRNNHEGLYRTLEQVSKVRPLTPAELHDVNQILDYRMVSDEVVKSAFRHPKLGFSHSLLNRAMELEISKLDKVKLHYEEDDDSLSSRDQLVRSRKCHLILEKALRKHMRASMLLSEKYRSLEEKVDALSRSSV